MTGCFFLHAQGSNMGRCLPHSYFASCKPDVSISFACLFFCLRQLNLLYLRGQALSFFPKSSPVCDLKCHVYIDNSSGTVFIWAFPLNSKAYLNTFASCLLAISNLTFPVLSFQSSMPCLPPSAPSYHRLTPNLFFCLLL